jgi:hypothetical protein
MAIMSINTSLEIIGNTFLSKKGITTFLPKWYTFHSHFWYIIAFPVTIEDLSTFLDREAFLNFIFGTPTYRSEVIDNFFDPGFSGFSGSDPMPLT